MRVSISSALVCLIAVVGCGGLDQTANDFVGSWAVTKDSRSVLPVESRQADGKLTLAKNGEFVSYGVPGELLYSMPGMNAAIPVSGVGTWRLGKVDNNAAILLTFRSIDGATEYKVPNGTQLLIDNLGRQTVLYFFLGDPDGGKRVDFRKIE
jgi:hypothetical protein